MQEVTPVPLIVRLGNDVFADITKLLDSGSLGALVLCGDRRLQYKLSRHVPTVRHHSDTRRFTWPFYIRDWIGLKHLRVHPGYAFELRKTNATVKAIALAERVLQSLPPLLESLQLDDSVLPFRDAFRIAWQQSHQTDLTNHLSGNLAMLCRTHLPNLRSLSFASNPKMPDNVVAWVNGAEQLPLMRLSLSHLNLSHLDPCLCHILYSLPRTLTDLELHINNRHDTLPLPLFRDAFDVYTPLNASVIVDDAFFANALPPHLTRLKFDLKVTSHVPAALLSTLSSLTTLSLCMRERAPSSVARFTLSHLPASVTKLSLKGLLTTDLQSYMVSIPEEHCALRQLTVKNVVFPPGTRGPYDFLHTIASRASFKQLEALHVFINRDAIGLFMHNYFASNSTIVDEIMCEGLKSMTRLRSISDFFTWMCFTSFWEYCATSFLVENDTALTIRYDNRQFTNVDAHWLRRLLSNPIKRRVITDTFVLVNSMSQILSAASNDALSPSPSNGIETNDPSQQPSPVDIPALNRMLETVKHLRIASNADNLDALHHWPTGCQLDSLDMATHPFTRPFEDVFQTLPVCLRTLRVLEIDCVVKVTCLSDCLRLMPETLESLKIWSASVDDELSDGSITLELPSKHILAYIPPRLQIMDVSGGFAIGKETFDAMPSSLHTVRWDNVMGVYCSASDMCRWPRNVRFVHLVTVFGAHLPRDYAQYAHNLKEWYQDSPRLVLAQFLYYANRSHHVLFSRRSFFD